MKIRVLLADDHDVVREGVRRVLEREADIDIVGEAVDVFSAWQLYSEHSPDVLVMDLSMPGSSGVAGLGHILQRDSSAKIVIFTIHENPLLVDRVIAAGALGFVSKSCPSSELVQAVRLAYENKPYVSSDLAQTLIFKQNLDKSGGLPALTEREFNIFCLLVEGKTITEISEQLFLAEKTIANYISLVKQKLGVKNTIEMVHLALQNKLIDIDGLSE
mgnify:CR=1 FL=1